MIKSVLKKINNMIVPLRVSMLFLFISLFVTTILLILLVTTQRYSEALSRIAHQRMMNESLLILNKLHKNLMPAQIHSQFAAHLIQEEVIQNSALQIMPLTVNIVKMIPIADGAHWADEKGNFIFSLKEPNGSITTNIYQRNHGVATRTIINRDIQGKIIKKYLSNDLRYDPRTRPWFLLAKKEKTTIWTNVYLFYFLHNKGVTVSTPAFKNGKLFGVFSLDINLNDLSQFIKKIQKITPNSYVFIVDKEGSLIIASGDSSFTKLIANTDVHSTSLIDRTFQEYQRKGGTGLLTFSYLYNNQTYMVTYVPSITFATHGWFIGIIAPQNDFISNLRKMNLVTIYISLSILILGIFLVSSLVSHIVKPLKILVAETENIKQFNLGNKIVIKSRIKEVIQLRNAVNSMKLGLKLFQKYIPKVLVRQLIESGEDIRTGGVRKTMTVLFSDIKGFTTIVEKMDPSELMQQMGEYLEELSQIIIDEKGTIDKYIGDSIMAFWGAPLPDEQPCHHAARAALRCQKKLDELNKIWQQKGKEAFFTRIGIHMGDAIVGNLGSSERLNYTAIGDTINTASRLENINKNYGTKIIVSDTVYEIIKDQFILRMIDCVVVKGRTQSCCIYELLTDDIQNLEFDLHAYNSAFEQGFLVYKQQLWDEAIEHFKRCLEIYPADLIAPIFIERCQHFKSNPPKPGWKGIME
ncbi:guanylate cyclase [Legionella steigerwaltii]|uniref:Guanylate cyclase n=1 Tax=Legionella steigerwaltii TaxID=460 RepID=A0A378L6G3_9GAMM|nr:adenylate/guanylate cyclase domain-containing protein [Legionella steigerwaltii]KTD77479.1 guanylate cyclase [Legionella steigerwaltii]STY22665.1 guanylate cyclase [Legionella steigerwaltii]